MFHASKLTKQPLVWKIPARISHANQHKHFHTSVSSVLAVLRTESTSKAVQASRVWSCKVREERGHFPAWTPSEDERGGRSAGKLQPAFHSGGKWECALRTCVRVAPHTLHFFKRQNTFYNATKVKNCQQSTSVKMCE